MRVSWCLAALVVLLLPAVPVIADADHGDTACPTAPADTTADTFRIYAPDHGYTHHPIPVAIAATAEQAAHTTYDLIVHLDDTIIVDVPNIHEHDALHTTTFTPGAGDVVRIEVTERVGGEPANEAVRHVPLCPDFVPATQPSRVAGAFQEAQGGSLRLGLSGVQDQEPTLALLDVRDAQGRLTLSAWAASAAEVSVAYDVAGFAGGADAYFLPTPHEQHTFWARHTSHEWRVGAGPLVPVTGGQLPTGGDGLCSSTSVIVTDPDPAVAPTDGTGRPAWHADSDLRFAILRDPASSLEPIEYTLTQQSPGLRGVPSDRVTTHDPFGQLTLQIAEPGTYHLTARASGDTFLSCVAFDVIPNNADGGPGTVVAEVVPDGGQVDITFSAERDGAKLGHYEFDTRVYRVETTEMGGALVWMGKLHGHAGVASAHLAGLAPGQYQVITFPSPQNMGTAPVVADDVDGFRWFFTIEPPEEAGRGEEFDPIPLPGLPLVVAALVGVVVALRRRSITP